MSRERFPNLSGSFRPDYAAWAIYPTWTLDEATALSVGVEPTSLIRSKNNFLYQSDLRPVKEAVEDRRRLLGRFEPLRRLGGIQPRDFVTLVRSVGIDVPDALTSAVDAIAPPVDWRGRAAHLEKRVLELEADVERLAVPQQKSDLPERERTSLLKLVIGMAVAGYSFDPRASKSGAIKEITDDLERLGIGLTDDTVRKYLREGRDLLPPPETE